MGSKLGLVGVFQEAGILVLGFWGSAHRHDLPEVQSHLHTHTLHDNRSAIHERNHSSTLSFNLSINFFSESP